MSIVAVCGLLLSACANTPDQPPKSPTMPASTRDLFNAVPPRGLPPQRLDPGECGLFLWGQTPPNRFIFFSKAGSGAGIALIEESAVNVQLTAGRGPVFGEFNTNSDYITTDRIWEVSIEVEPGEMLEDGQRVESGRMLQTNPEGWQTILPVIGVRACIPG